MDKLQEATTENNEEDLKWKYINILTFWVMGFKYEDIAEKTGYSYQYIRRLFAKGGKLRGIADNFREVAHKESVNEAVNVLFGNLPDIARSLAQTAKMPFDMSGVAAGRTILEYTLGKPIDRQKDGGELGLGTTADLVERVMLRRNQNNEPTARRTDSEGVAGESPKLP